MPPAAEEADIALVSVTTASSTGDCLGSGWEEDWDSWWGGFWSDGYWIDMYDWNGDGIADGLGWSDEYGMVYVSNLPGNLFEEWPSINENNFEEMLRGYDPSEWPSIEAYFDWWEWESMLPPEPAQETVHADTSVTHHPKVNCVVENLKAYLTNMLQSGNSLNIKVVADLKDKNGKISEGATSSPPNGQGQYTITLRGDEFAYDDYYSRIALASTIIHEAYHLKILQIALPVYGSQAQDLSTWLTPPADPILLELYQAYQYHKGLGTEMKLDALEHEWMTNHLDELAGDLKTFVEINYPSIASTAGNTLDAYKALFLTLDGGMKQTPNRYYRDKMNELGGNSGVIESYSKLTSLENINCPN